MQSRNTIFKAVLCAMLILPGAAAAQSSSLNTYSPYSMYGIGDLSTVGGTSTRAMGGAGIAYRDQSLTPYSHSANLLNPASYSSIPQNSFLFDVGLEAGNYYLKQGSKKTSFNTGNIKNISMLFPVAKKVGVGISLTPYSSVGYEIEEKLTGVNIESNFIDVRKVFEGEGNFNQAKIGVGWEITKGLSIGADMIYMFGNTERNYSIEVTGVPGFDNYLSSTAIQKEHISKIFGMVGVQYDAVREQDKVVTVGATYRMGGKLKPEIEKIIPTDIYHSELVTSDTYKDHDLSLADVLSLGAFYHTKKTSIGMDYIYENWASKNNSSEYRNTSTVKLGVAYTPNFIDVRSRLNRMTYRFGVRYGQNYTKINGEGFDDMALTLGVSIPTKYLGRTKVDLGAELGQRGKSSLIKENYIKFSVGMRFFGEDGWFVKRKYK